MESNEQNTLNSNQEKPKKKKYISKKKVVIMVSLLVLVVLSVSVVLLYKNFSENTTLNEEKFNLQDSINNQGFGGEVTGMNKNNISVKNEGGEEKTFKLNNKTKVLEGLASTETSIDKVRVGAKVDIGYLKNNNEVQSIWLWTN